MSVLEQENTMKAIIELTIAAAAVAFLVAVAFQINHAQARSPVPIVHEIDLTDAAGVKPMSACRGS
jgi:hypothetical protein